MKRRQFKPKAFGVYKPKFADYEKLKREWTAANQNATPTQYQEAMTRIAQQCGI